MENFLKYLDRTEIGIGGNLALVFVYMIFITAELVWLSYATKGGWTAFIVTLIIFTQAFLIPIIISWVIYCNNRK